MGIPTIMSPVGVNTEIIEHGVNGFLAGTTEEWVNCLSALIEDEAMRKRLGEAALSTVEERYSKNAWKDTYVRVFQEI
jgi:glycosyltransferase involved in cell wall biosynthesis